MFARRHTVLAGIVLAGLIALPAQAQIPERISLPPTLERAPEDARYVEPAFTYRKTASDIVYGQAVNNRGELQELQLDVYEPDGNDDEFRPVIVWATGGGFIRAGKENLYFAPWLLERGYVVVSINYRVRPDLPYAVLAILAAGPDAIIEARDAALDAQHDMQAAIRWVRANAADLRVDPTQIVASGYSAGGIMALMAAFNDNDVGDSGNPGWPSHVAAAVGGGSSYSPVLTGTGMGPGDPPIAVFHGALDDEVPMPTAALPCLLTTLLANTCEAHIYPEEDHGMSRPAHWPDVAAESADFLWRHVLDATRTETSFVDVATSTRGETVTVSGRLVAHDRTLLLGRDRPVNGARILARAGDGWSEATTGDDGRFTVDVDAPDHGRTTQVLLRYEGHSTGSWLDGPAVAPTSTTTTATWGAGG